MHYLLLLTVRPNITTKDSDQTKIIITFSFEIGFFFISKQYNNALFYKLVILCDT